MTIVGYARVSTLDQDHTTLLERLTAAGCTKLFSEKKSGTNQTNTSELEACLDWIREGDTVTVTKIDRLARSAQDLYNIVERIEKKGATLQALDQHIDTRTPHGKALLGMLAIFAEFETNIRKERQLEGIAKAKSKGAYKGRKPTAQAKKSEMERLLNEGMSKPQIAKKLGISTASVYNIIK